MIQYENGGSRHLMIPPINFGMVSNGIYRSGYPNAKNMEFLKKLGLKSMIIMCEDVYSDEYREFFRLNGIELYHFQTTGNKEPFLSISTESVVQVLSILTDERQHPVLVHCNKGTHRTGCVIACLRKLQHWSLTSIFFEYRKFAGNRVRLLDQQFVEQFNPKSLNLAEKKDIEAGHVHA